MEWPLLNTETNKPLTTPTAKYVWREALSAIESTDTTLADRITAWRKQLDATDGKKWRSQYVDLVNEFARIMASATPSEAVLVAKTGLDALGTSLVFHLSDDNIKIPARQAFFDEDYWNDRKLETLILKGTNNSGTGTPCRLQLASHHKDAASKRNILLTGKAAKKQLETWANYGCMEHSAAQHASRVFSNIDASPLVQDKIFVLLGGTSSLGPARSLLCIPGARVLVIAREGARLRSLKEWFQKEAATNTVLNIPKGGADMLKQGPQIARWVTETIQIMMTIAATDKPSHIVVNHLAYMDGEAHVRVSVAMDLITEYVIEKFKVMPEIKVSLSYLSSPGTAHAVPKQYALEAQRRYNNRPMWHRAVQMCSGNKWLQPINIWEDEMLQTNTESGSGGMCVYNGLFGMQGPNYALAKTMQMWRGMVHASQKNNIVSAPMAPPTRSESMVSFASIAAALEGQQHFEPLVAFDTETTSTLMTAIMLSQINSTVSVKTDHPMQLFWDGSVHGGFGRLPYTIESMSVVWFFMGRSCKAGWCPEGALAPLISSGEEDEDLGLAGNV